MRDLAAGKLHNPVSRQRPSRSTEAASYLRVTPFSDTAVALVALLVIFILDNLGHLPKGWEEFVNARLTVKNLGLLAFFAGVWYFVFRTLGLYVWKSVKRLRGEAIRVCAGTAIGTTVAFIFPLTSDSGAFRYEVVLLFFVIASAAILLARMTLRIATTSRIDEVQNIVILGSGPRAAQIYRQLWHEGSPPRNVLGFFDSSFAASAEQEIPKTLTGSLNELEQFLMEHPVDEVVIALPVRSHYAAVQDAIQICERVGVPITHPADTFTHVRAAPRFQTAGPAPVLSYSHSFSYGPWFAVKRAIDILGASVGLVIFTPLIGLAALLIRATSRGPVFFCQERCGRNKRRFTMYKLRTMVADADVQQFALEARNEAAGPVFKIQYDPRVTRVGALLRRLSIDELPQLWNVLRGEMSLVGPRPLPLRDVQRFSESWLMRRFSVVPGMTGLWQVSGRSTRSWDEWIALDLAYVDRWSLWLDLEILGLTVPAVLSGKGAT
jgi:exopolysaccharide biosynthesis polyprenyl glycosylphosphotransferase